MLHRIMWASALLILSACSGVPAGDVTDATDANIIRSGASLVVRPDSPDAAAVRLEVIAPRIIRVSADPSGAFARDPSLMVVPQAPFEDFTVTTSADHVDVATSALIARVERATGQVTFLDAAGEEILAESPRRTFTATSVSGEPFYAIRQVFESDPDEGFYGLGQHQSGVMNYNGKDVELAQHNVSIAVPFVVSTGDYGVLWDNSSNSRFGDPRPYCGLDDLLIVRGADGTDGGLTGEYYDGETIAATTQEADPDYQFLPEDQFATGTSVRDVYPAPFGTTDPDKIVWTGSIEALSAGTHKFRVYASNYIKVTIDGETVVDRWRQNWNPYFFDFDLDMAPGEQHSVTVEWIPDAGYFRFLHLDPMPADERHALSLSSEVAEILDYYFIQGDDMDEVISGYRQLTGKAVLLPKWAYGFWQSRQRYTTQDELVGALAEYRDRSIPIDNIVLDWFYWPEDAWGSHQFDATRFPDPAGMVGAVHDMNAQVMISVWPKFYPTTDNFKELDAENCIYRGNLDRGALDWVGPGYANAFVDQYSDACRAIFWRQMQEGIDSKGFDAWWMDATEPDMHSNTSNADRAYRMGPTAMGPAEQYFNSFVLMNSRAVYEGERAGTDPDKRVFILTRSGFPGLQRYASASWSGDIVARWDDLREQISAGVNFSLSGLPNWTHDIGGFAVEARYTSEDPAHVEEWQELNLRWFQFGAFSPIFRSHGEYPYREIYNIAPDGSAVQDSLIWHDRLRYRLMPYIYSLAAGTYHDDGTIMRGLVMDFEDDRNVWDIADEYMFGPGILVSPVHEFHARSRKVYLPAGTGWQDFYSGDRTDGGQSITADAPLERLPLYVRDGAILPMGPDIQYAAEGNGRELHLYVFPGADGSFDLFEDDGVSYAYETGAWSRTPIRWDDAAGTLTFGPQEGTYTSAASREVNVHLVRPGAGFSFDRVPDMVFTYSGKEITAQLK